MTAREIEKVILKDGWVECPGNGSSHRQYKHPTKPGRVTIPFHGNKDLHIGTVNSIMKQAGLK